MRRMIRCRPRPEDLTAFLADSGVGEAVRCEIVKNAVRLDTQPGVDLGALLAREGSAPGNVRVISLAARHWMLHLGDLFEALLSSADALGSAQTGDVWSAVLEVLNALRSLASASHVTLGDREARLVVDLWKDGAPGRIRKAEALEQCGLADGEFEAALDALLAIGTIDIEAGEWVVRTESIYFV